MLRLAILTAIMTSMIVGPTPAQALSKVECSSQQKASTQLWCGKENVRRGNAALRFLRNNAHAGDSESRYSLRRSGRYLLLYGRKHINHATSRILPPHVDGWLCIHKAEGAWDDGGSPYYGGLQMSWNWMKAVPGGDAGKLPPLQQMWIAEKVSARHGFSYNWMRGQWPNTFPPCANYF